MKGTQEEENGRSEAGSPVGNSSPALAPGSASAQLPLTSPSAPAICQIMASLQENKEEKQQH